MQRSHGNVRSTTDIVRPSVRLRRLFAGIVSFGLLFAAASPVCAAPHIDFAGTWKVVVPRTSILPDDGTIPFTAKGRERYKENVRSKARKDLEFDLTTSRCSSPGMPRVMLTPQRFRIFQDSAVMMIAFEWNRVRRAIGMPALSPQISLFNAADDAKLVGTKMGTARARWEGNTLVIVTNELSDTTLLDDLVPHGFGLKIVEQLTLKDADTLEDRITIEDPEYFTKPWSTVLTYARQSDAIFPEDVCLDRLLGKPDLPTH